MSVPLHKAQLSKSLTVRIYSDLREHYDGCKLITVHPTLWKTPLGANAIAGRDIIELLMEGNENA